VFPSLLTSQVLTAQVPSTSWSFFYKLYLQYVNTLTAVLDNTKIVPGQPISYRTLAVRGGHGTTGQGMEGTAVEKWHKRKNTAAEGYEIKGEYV
jgi:hypothetical protein